MDNADSQTDNADSQTDTRDKPDTPMSGLSAEELAARLGVSPRTIRRWARAGKLSGETVRGARGPELRFSPAAGEFAARQKAGGNADNRDSQTDKTDRHASALRQELADQTARAEQRLSGAHQAARVAARLLGETRASLAREQARADRLAEELAALRAELAGERERNANAERELRVLLLRSSESLTQALEGRQTPALESRGKRAWWSIFSR